VSSGTTSQADRAATRRVALRTPSGVLAFGFGSGLSRFAPGTVGTAAGMILWLPAAGLAPPVALALIGAAFVLGVAVCRRASHALGVHDHGGIVWDEFVGIWLVLAFMPLSWGAWLAAFVAFRAFDILKPWPIGWLDKRVTGGLGIMIDDVVAAGYALLALEVMQWLPGQIPF